MAVIEKNYVINNIISGYIYNLIEGQTYENPLSTIEPATGITICQPIDLDVGTFNVSASLDCVQYSWNANNNRYEATGNETTRYGTRYFFKHSTTYEFLKEITTTNLRFDKISYDVLRTNCVAFKWLDTFSSLPSENVGSPIYVPKTNGKSCKGYKELWHLDVNSELQIDNLPVNVDKLGAFANAENLVEISIPPSVKKIGRYSFANTSLTSVRIARDCTYYPTSFPQGCTIHYY